MQRPNLDEMRERAQSLWQDTIDNTYDLPDFTNQRVSEILMDNAQLRKYVLHLEMRLESESSPAQTG